MKRVTKILNIVLLLLGLAGIVYFGARASHEPKPENRPDFPRAQLTIERQSGGALSYDIEVARTPTQLEYGLMFVKEMPANEGMAFIFNPPEIVTFWMKNTYIPLDMLYIRADGTIARIIEQAKPLDLTPLPSKEPIAMVVEINGGEAARQGIREGDKAEIR